MEPDRGSGVSDGNVLEVMRGTLAEAARGLALLKQRRDRTEAISIGLEDVRPRGRSPRARDQRRLAALRRVHDGKGAPQERCGHLVRWDLFLDDSL